MDEFAGVDREVVTRRNMVMLRRCTSVVIDAVNVLERISRTPTHLLVLISTASSAVLTTMTLQRWRGAWR